MKKCTKRRYDKLKAMLVLAKLKNAKNGHRLEKRIYFCTQCKSYHLTSMDIL